MVKGKGKKILSVNWYRNLCIYQTNWDDSGEYGSPIWQIDIETINIHFLVPFLSILLPKRLMNLTPTFSQLRNLNHKVPCTLQHPVCAPHHSITLGAPRSNLFNFFDDFVILRLQLFKNYQIWFLIIHMDCRPPLGVLCVNVQLLIVIVIVVVL